MIKAIVFSYHPSVAPGATMRFYGSIQEGIDFFDKKKAALEKDRLYDLSSELVFIESIEKENYVKISTIYQNKPIKGTITNTDLETLVTKMIDDKFFVGQWFDNILEKMGCEKS